jgi:hypothetical protein
MKIAEGLRQRSLRAIREWGARHRNPSATEADVLANFGRSCSEEL